MIKHPAVYSEEILPVLANLAIDENPRNILDPFAGTGKIALIKQYGYKGIIVCNEIEPEWANSSTYPVDEWYVSDADNMYWAFDDQFECAMTSPVYGNRMSDHYNRGDLDKSVRLNYHEALGRDLNVENTGRMQWGESYRTKHKMVYNELQRVLQNEALFVLNVSNHIRNGAEVPVSEWHFATLVTMGFRYVEDIHVETKRYRRGRNGEKRVGYEHIYVFRNEK